MSTFGWILIASIIIALASLFFSVNLIVLRSLSRPKLHEELKAAGKEKYFDKLINNLETYIITSSIYRLAANTALFVIILKLVALKIDTSHLLLAAIITFTALLTFSLAIPQAWAKYAGPKFLAQNIALLSVLIFPLYPIVAAVNIYDMLIKRLAGVPETTPEEEQEEKQEEFITDLEQYRMEGTVDLEEQEMIENVLELSETSAGEIMTPRTDMVAIEVSENLENALTIINKAGHSRLPVYETNVDNILGLLYAKDLLTEIGQNPAQFSIKKKMRPAYFVPETKLLRELLHEFQAQKLHIAVVLDEYGGTAGIVTIEDILEELVGEITDEYENIPPKQIKQIDDNTFEVNARTYVDELNDQFDLDIPEEEDYDTIGGFVFSHLGNIPKTGQKFEYKNLHFTVIAAEPRKIKRLRIQKNQPEQK